MRRAREAAFLGFGVLLLTPVFWGPATTSSSVATPGKISSRSERAESPKPTPPPGPEVRALRRDLSGFLGGSRMRSAQWSVLVVSLDRGDTLFARNEALSVVPASNMKVVTVAAALHFLGSSFAYRTFLWGDGPTQEGHLRGDLILYGTGDPGISDRFFRTRTSVFEDLADQLAAEGVRHIDGAVVGDGTYFSGPLLGPGWNPRDLNERFAAAVTGLSYNENFVMLRIAPSTRLGGAPTVETIPPGFPLELDNTAETVAGPPRPMLWLDRPTPTSQIRIHGEITRGGPAIWRRLTVPDPPLYAARALLEVLESRGFRVRSGARSVHGADRSRITGGRAWAPGLADTEQPRLLASHTSPELIEYLNVINHESHNLFAESIFKTMGRVVMSEGSFVGGARAVRSFTTEEVGLGTHDVVAVDGSGLSEGNRSTAGGLVAVMHYMAHSPWWEGFLSTFPEAGTRSLRRMYGTRAARNLRAKTGTIEGVSALTGVVTAQNGERLLFSILSNGHRSTSAAKRVEDRIAARLADFLRAPPEAQGS